MAIKAPMLAATVPVGNVTGKGKVAGRASSPATFPGVVFPTYATTKLDGVRALKVHGQLVSRQFKPLPNEALRRALEAALPDGADGEVMFGDTFQACTSAVMSARPDLPNGLHGFRFYWFDFVPDLEDGGGAALPYTTRVRAMQDWAASADGARRLRHAHAYHGLQVVLLVPTVIPSAAALQRFEARALADGFEGVILRRGDGRYKFGRATAREGIMLKLKRFQDSEAIVVDVEELMHNGNKATVDAFGHVQRSTHIEHQVASNMLGALVVEDAKRFPGVRFKVGTGFTVAQRRDLWSAAARGKLRGCIVKYKFMAVGMKHAPRHPVFLGFRHPDDM